jgi:hypothetical protein
MILEHNPADRAAIMDGLVRRSGWVDWVTKHPEKEARLRKILATAQLAQFPGAVVPRLMQGRMVYYAVADSGKQWRMLQGLLRAFVGTTLTDFQGLPAVLDSADPFEAYLADHLSGPVARFSPGGVKKLEQATVVSLELMVELAEGEGKLQRAVPRSTRQVLSEFRLALAAGNDNAAGEALAFLRTQMRLDSLNLCYLEVERYQARRDWEGLLEAPFFPVLVNARRPPKVTGALLQALYRTRVERVVADGGLDAVLAAFREHVRIPFGSLLKTLPLLPEPGVALLFLAEAYLRENPAAPVVAVVRREHEGYPVHEGALASALLKALAPIEEPRVPSPTEAAPTPQGAMALVVTALEVGSLAAIQEAQAYVDRFTEPEREALFEQRAFRTLWKELTDASGQQRVPSSWIELLHALPHLRYAEVKALAERAQVEWSVAGPLATPADSEALAESVQAASSTSTNEVTTLLPYLVEWVTRDDAWPNPECLSLYEALLLCLNLSDQHGQGLLDATSTLVHGCLHIGIPHKAYQVLLKDLGDRASTVAGLKTADWVLDIGEQILIHPCPDPEARSALWVRLQTALVPVLPRLRVEQIALLEEISAAIGIEPIRAAGNAGRAAEAEAGTAPSGLLALYTLQPSVSQRVESILSRTAPGLQLEICADMVATDRLKNLARTADQFIVCWQDAKHAATQEISRLRPRQRPVRWATGAGSSAVLRMVRELWPAS